MSTIQTQKGERVASVPVRTNGRVWRIARQFDSGVILARCPRPMWATRSSWSSKRSGRGRRRSVRADPRRDREGVRVAAVHRHIALTRRSYTRHETSRDALAQEHGRPPVEDAESAAGQRRRQDEPPLPGRCTSRAGAGWSAVAGRRPANRRGGCRLRARHVGQVAAKVTCCGVRPPASRRTTLPARHTRTVSYRVRRRTSPRCGGPTARSRRRARGMGVTNRVSRRRRGSCG